MRKGVVFGLIVGLVAIAFAGTVAASSQSFTLWGNAMTGWGFTSGGETIPGPTMTVNNSDVVTMNLHSNDGLPHQWFIDYNGNGVPDPGEPTSPFFSTSTSYTFTANASGGFQYRCSVHPGTMFGSWVTNAPPTVHDIAVTGVATNVSSVVRGGSVNVTVQVKNQGNVADTTTVTAHAGSTAIGNQTVALPAGQTKSLFFNWDTTPFQPGNYTVSGNASVVPGEVNTSNNQKTDGTVWVKAPPPPPPGNLKATLIGKSAWPAHHHFNTARFGPVQTLFGKIGNIGPGPVDAKVRFTIRDDAGAVVAVVDSNAVVVAVGGDAVVMASWTVTGPGRFHVSAQCWYDSNNDGTFDGASLSTKTFSFAVV